MPVRSKCAKIWTADFFLPVFSRFVLSLLFTVSFFLLMLTSYANAAQVTLSWQDLNNDPAEVGGYNLYYWQTGQTPSMVNVGDTLTYTLTGLNADTTYHFATTAHDGNGGRESASSNEAIYTIPPDPPALSASLSATPVSGPAPLMVTFADTSSGAITSWSWNFGDGSTSTVQHPTHTYTTAGTYSVILTVTGSGSTKTATTSITVTPAGSGSMALVDAHFSSGAEGFGYVDDAFRTTSQPAYAAGAVSNGNLQVTLGGLDANAITGMSGGWRTSFSVPGATPATVTLSFAYNLTQTSQYENDEYSDVLVTVGTLQPGSNGQDYVARIVGDGNGGNAVSTGWRTFTTTLSLAPGTYTLTLGGFNNKKTASDETTTILIDDVSIQTDVQASPPVAAFTATPTSGAAPLAVNFTDASTGSISSRSWDFGDGSSSTAPNPSHTYTASGAYTATLTVTGPGGSHTASTLITVIDTLSGCPCSLWDDATTPAVAAFADTAAVELGMKFRADVDGHITAIRFYKGTGNTGTHLGHLWTNNGTLLGSVTFSNETGSGWQQATLSTPVAITANTTYVVSYYAPVGRYAANASYFTTAVTNPPLLALASGSSGGNGVYKYGTSGFPNQTFNANNYWVDVVFVPAATPEPTPLPVAAFSAAPTSGTAPLIVNFTNTSSGAIDSHRWDFGDGGTSTAANPSHTYATPGAYTVTLTVTGAGGTDATSTSITVATAMDSDGDGIPDADEAQYGTSPTLADTDHDGVSDNNEVAYWGENWNVNYDNDAIANNLLDPDADNDGYTDGLELHYGSDPADPSSTPALTDIMVIGDVQVDHTWRQVTFTVPFLDPVVVAKPLSTNESDPAVVRIRNVTPNGFDIRVQEWDYLNGTHTTETVSYMVMERGSFVLDNGTANGIRVEAGSFDTNRTSFTSIPFSQPFNVAPVVLTAVTSVNEADAVTGRLRNISTTAFQFRLQEQEKNSNAHARETVTYIAWEPSSGTIDGLTFEVNTTSKAVTHQFYPIGFTAPFAAAPVFVADMQTTAGGDTANLRWRNKGPAGVDVQVVEEQSKDSETNHATEVVGYIAIR